jgi:hypothetical protein
MELIREMIPTYRRDGYTLPTDAADQRARAMPLALWLTQPRFALGLDQQGSRRVHLRLLKLALSLDVPAAPRGWIHAVVVREVRQPRERPTRTQNAGD